MPDEVRPARPARWVADACETGTVTSEESDVVGLYVRIYSCRLDPLERGPKRERD